MTALQALLIFLISFMVVAVLFKMPVSFALGTSSLLVLAFGGYNLVTVPQFAFSGLDSFALLAIPFYIFAGVIMEYSGISKMLIDWIKSFVGSHPRRHRRHHHLRLHGLRRSDWLGHGYHLRHRQDDGARAGKRGLPQGL